MLRTMAMREFHDARKGVVVGIDYRREPRERGLPVRVMVELREQKFRPEHKRYEWTGQVVKCSKVLEDKYLGAMLWVRPDDRVTVLA